MRRRPSDIDIARFQRRLQLAFSIDGIDDASEKTDSADGDQSRLFNDLDMHGPKAAEISEMVFNAFRSGGVRDPNTFPTWLKKYWLLTFENFFGEADKPTLPQWIKIAYQNAIGKNFDDLNEDQRLNIISHIFSAYIENCVEAFTRLMHEEGPDVFKRMWTVGTFLAETNPAIYNSAEINAVFGWYKNSFNKFEDQYKQWVDSERYKSLVDFLAPFTDPRQIIGKIKTEILRLGETPSAKVIEEALKNILLEQPDSIIHSRAQQLLDSRELLQKILPVLHTEDLIAYNNILTYANSPLTIKEGVTIKLIQRADQFSSQAIQYYTDININEMQLIDRLKKQDVELRYYHRDYQLTQALQITNSRYLQKHAAGYASFEDYKKSCGWGWRWPLYKRCRNSVEIAFQLKEKYENALKPEASSTERAKVLLKTQDLKRGLQKNDGIFSTLFRLIFGLNGGSELYHALDRVMPVVPTSIQAFLRQHPSSDAVRKPSSDSINEEKPMVILQPQAQSAVWNVSNNEEPDLSEYYKKIEVEQQELEKNWMDWHITINGSQSELKGTDTDETVAEKAFKTKIAGINIRQSESTAAQVAHSRAELTKDSPKNNISSTPPVTVTTADNDDESEAAKEEGVLNLGPR